MWGDTEQGESGALGGEISTLAIAAHELKAPLVLLRQLSLLLEEEAKSPDAVQTTQTLAQRMTFTSERSLRLVDMLTKHARLDEGLFALEPVHIGRVCEEVAHELTPLAQAMNRRFEVHTSHRPTIAVANHDLVRSIAFGLCDNALSYTTDSTRAIRLTTSQPRRDETVQLRVRDHGARMPADTLRRLQERLGKHVQPIGRRPTSSGLGLYVAGQFADAMRGTLGMQRHREVGATFYVELPASSQLSLL